MGGKVAVFQGFSSEPDHRQSERQRERAREGESQTAVTH